MFLKWMKLFFFGKQGNFQAIPDFLNTSVYYTVIQFPESTVSLVFCFFVVFFAGIFLSHNLEFCLYSCNLASTTVKLVHAVKKDTTQTHITNNRQIVWIL